MSGSSTDRRTIKRILQPTDKLFFLHIPKTGGMSLISVLDAQFPPEQIFPHHNAEGLNADDFQNVDEYKAVRLVRGHFPHGPLAPAIYRYLTEQAIFLTILRDPIARVISNYKHFLRNPQIDIRPRHIEFLQHTTDPRDDPPNAGTQRQIETRQMTLKEFVCDPRYFNVVVNRQTRIIVGSMEGNSWSADQVNRLDDATLLALAKQRLDEFAFVGLTERYRPCLQLLTYIFAWPPVAHTPQINAAPEPIDYTSIPQDTLDAIRERTQLDAELYQYAAERFDADYTGMVDELLGVAHAYTYLEQKAGFLGDSLDEMHSSPGGRLILKLNSLRIKLFPQGSRRERVYLFLRDRLLSFGSR